jgi:Fe-S-cluster containining protein
MNTEPECSCCGKCCQNMRPYMTVGTRSRDGSLACHCTLTKESFNVVVPNHHLSLMYDRNFLFRYPKACPFLAKNEEESFFCIIYPDRPGHCRTYFCKRPDKDQK